MDLWIFAFGLGVAGLVAGGVTLTILEVGRADKARHGNTAGQPWSTGADELGADGRVVRSRGHRARVARQPPSLKFIRQCAE